MSKESNESKIALYIGNKIRERRKQLRLSQHELANILGISYQQTQKYESGHTALAVNRLFEICTALNVPASYFYEGAPKVDAIGKSVRSEILLSERTKPLQILLVEANKDEELLFRKAVSAYDKEVDIYTINEPEKVMDYISNSEEKYGRSKPDIVLMDINFPKIDGLQLLKQIKRSPASSNIPVIILTNSTRAQDMLEAYKLNASGFIQKSVNFSEFSKNIAMIVDYWSNAVILPSMAHA